MEWWRGAVVYQVYLRSFCDSNGDGQGDLPGLISKLDYIAGLGVDAIWLSPIHPSPNRDWGYDVSDYEAVHPDYGTLADFEQLIEQAHARGIKILLDEVLCHTSDEHPWFVESLRSPDNARSDWYVWADPHEDGTAPNNWLSVFGGPAWSYRPERRQHYHHKFLRQQPKLNWHNAGARAAAQGILDLWLQRGVDGFRLDVANAFLHDPSLTDNPAVPKAERSEAIWSHVPYFQHHLHESNLPQNVEALDKIRRTVERYPDRFVFGEFSEEAERSGCYAAPSAGLHSGYSFPMLLQRKLAPDFFREYYAMLVRFPDHWPSISFSNHDVMRAATRFGGGHHNQALAKLLLALLFSLKGTVLLYQGEELGLPEADLRRDQLRDPVGDLYYPASKGRDGCRTPMPWQSDEPNLGFTSGTPWLPFFSSHRELAVDVQEADKNSTLSFTRELLRLRRDCAALRFGEIEFLDAPDTVLAFRRRLGDESVLCLFNMGEESVRLSPLLSVAAPLRIMAQSGTATREGDALLLGPYGAAIGQG